MQTMDMGRAQPNLQAPEGGGDAQQRITLDHLHFQQDPNDPEKWIITYTDTPLSRPPTSPGDESLFMMDNEYDVAILSDSPVPKRRDRSACDCPNCQLFGALTGDGKRFHSCHICNKTYKKTSLLRNHLRGHAGIKPYACDWHHCESRFTRSDELRRHRLTHSGERKFTCSDCGKHFMRRDHLTRHESTHVSSSVTQNDTEQSIQLADKHETN